VSTQSKLWRLSPPRKELEVRILETPSDHSQLGAFVAKYDSIRDDLETLVTMDDLLAGEEDGIHSVNFVILTLG